ncbi:MAG: hypothetical protein ACKOFU_01925 [Actinomycetota bacterium]
MRIKAALFLLVALLLSAVPTGAVGNSDPVVDNEWALSDPPMGTPSQGVWFSEPVLQPTSSSFLTSYTDCTGKGPDCAVSERRSEHICKTAKTESCATESGITYNAYLPKCKDETDTNCVEGVWLRKGEKKVYGDLDSYMPKTSPLHFAGDKSINLPEGKSTGLWRFAKGGIDDQEHLLSVSARLAGSSYERPLVKFPTPNRLEVVIDPVRLHKGDYQIPFPSTNSNGWTINGGYTRERDGSFGSTYLGFCSAVDVGVCARRQGSIEGARYGITLRLLDPPAAWLSGRLKDPSFDISSKNGSYIWEIEADPLVVPVSSAWMPNLDYEKAFPGQKISNMEATSWQGPLSRGELAIREFLRWEKVIGDKAGALHSRWSLESIQDSSLLINGKSLKECLRNERVAGVVTSNAMVFQDSPPKWNPAENSFDYVVAGPHLLPDGQENLGIYRVKLNQLFARCIYGLSDVPIVATVSVIGEGVVRKVATSSIQSGEGWINLSISGFTYSSPTLRFKLQAATPSPTPAATSNSSQGVTTKPSVTPTSSAKKGVSCVKTTKSKKTSKNSSQCSKYAKR